VTKARAGADVNERERSSQQTKEENKTKKRTKWQRQDVREEKG
jgi:hypothetical protein